MDYEYEYGRYKKKVGTLEKQLMDAMNKAEAWKELFEANNAIVAAIVDSMGGEYSIGRDQVTRAAQEGCYVTSSFDAETNEHKIRCVWPEE